MTTDNTALKTTLTVVAALAAIPLVLMVVVMPTMGLFGGGHAVGGPSGWQMLLFPLIPFTFVGGIGYLLYVWTSDRDNARTISRERQSARPLTELRTAYARGDLSTEEYESRRETLGARDSATGDDEVSTRD